MAAGVELIRLMADSDRPFFLETSTRYMSFIEPNVVPTFFPLRSAIDVIPESGWAMMPSMLSSVAFAKDPPT